MHTCAITTPTNGGGPSCDSRGETLPITTTAPSIMPMASDFSNIGGDGGQELQKLRQRKAAQTWAASCLVGIRVIGSAGSHETLRLNQRNLR
jgi:hypothetical protein